MKSQPKKTAFVWIIFSIVVIQLLWTIASLWFAFEPGYSQEVKTINVAGFEYLSVSKPLGIILDLIILSILAIYLVKLYRIKRDILMWNNIYFIGFLALYIIGLFVHVGQVITVFHLLTSSGATQTSGSIPILFLDIALIYAIRIVIISVIWRTFNTHLKKQVVN